MMIFRNSKTDGNTLAIFFPFKTALSKLRWLNAIAPFLLVSLSVTNAGGEVADSHNRKFQQGVDFAIQKKYEEAIAIWLPLLEVADSSLAPKIRKATSLAYKKLNRLPETWYHLTHYLKAAPKQDLKAGAWLEAIEKTLAKEHHKVSISCKPENALLYMGKGPDGPSYHCPITWWFRPGKHFVYATHKGYTTRTVQIDVLERGDLGTHKITLSNLKAVPSEKSMTVLSEKAPDTSVPSSLITHLGREGTRTALSWGVTGSGLAVILSGSILQLVAHSQNEAIHNKYVNKDKYPEGIEAKSRYNAAYNKEVFPKRTAAFALYGVGGVAAVTGITLLIAQRKKNINKRSSKANVYPLLSADGSGALFSIEF
jgi:hypothetical protein